MHGAASQALGKPAWDPQGVCSESMGHRRGNPAGFPHYPGCGSHGGPAAPGTHGLRQPVGPRVHPVPAVATDPAGTDLTGTDDLSQCLKGGLLQGCQVPAPTVGDGHSRRPCAEVRQRPHHQPAIRIDGHALAVGGGDGDERGDELRLVGVVGVEAQRPVGAVVSEESSPALVALVDVGAVGEGFHPPLAPCALPAGLDGPLPGRQRRVGLVLCGVHRHGEGLGVRPVRGLAGLGVGEHLDVVQVEGVVGVDDFKQGALSAGGVEQRGGPGGRGEVPDYPMHPPFRLHLTRELKEAFPFDLAALRLGGKREDLLTSGK